MSFQSWDGCWWWGDGGKVYYIVCAGNKHYKTDPSQSCGSVFGEVSELYVYVCTKGRYSHSDVLLLVKALRSLEVRFDILFRFISKVRCTTLQ